MKDVILPVAVAIALAFLIQAAVAKPYEIPTLSMYPTIKGGDRVIANRLIYKVRDIERGDIIVFQPTEAARQSCRATDNPNVPFVKRVIGLPGDRIELDESGQTLVNGKPLVVKNAGPNPQQLGNNPRRAVFGPVPAHKVFVLGDNRMDSCDSHQWSDPYVPMGNVIGEAEVTYWPLGHVKFLD